MTTDEAMAAYVDVLLKVRPRAAAGELLIRQVGIPSADRRPCLPHRQMLKRYKDRQEARDIIHEFRQARAMAASSSFAGSQDWQSTSAFSAFLSSAARARSQSASPPDRSDTPSTLAGSSSPPRNERSHGRTASSVSSSSTSSSPPAPIPPHLPSLTPSSEPTPRPTPAQSRLFEIPDPRLPPPDLSPPYQTNRLPGTSAASASGADNTDQPTVLPSSPPSRATAGFSGRSLPLPMPAPPRATSVPPPPRSLTPPLSSPPSGATATLAPVRPMLLSTTSVDSQAFSTALERIQASLSALHERLESLETTTLREQQRANPLRTLLFPPGGGRQVGIPRLLWTLAKRTFVDAFLALTCVSVWLLVTGQRGMRRSSVRDFWASIVQLLWRRWQQPGHLLPLPAALSSRNRIKSGSRGDR